MKLLLDQNLSWRLVKALQGSFAEIAHVRDFALDRAADADVWEYSRREGFVILSKDSDFEQRSLLHGHPAYSDVFRTVIPILFGQGSDSKRTPFRFYSDSVPG
jgi:predicted nuclease of predicted toxin-antitoxin system